MRKCCIDSNQKIQHKKVNQNLLFLTRVLPLVWQSTTYALLWSSTQWHKRMAKKEVVSVYFQWENNLIKIQKSTIKCAFSPPKGLKLQETQENVLSTCDKWMRKKEKGHIWEEWLFCKKFWGSTYPSSWWFLKSVSSGGFLSVVCVPEFICHTYLHEPLLPVNKFLLFLIKNRTLYWVGPPLIEWGPLLLSGTPLYWVRPSLNQ